MEAKKTINLYFDFEFTSLSPDAQPISLGIVSDIRDVRDYPLMTRPYKPDKKIEFIDQSLSFYSEFSDFDLNRCDDWVKENVVGKLKLKDAPYGNSTGYKNFKIEPDFEVKGDVFCIKAQLDGFLKQFSDYNIQFVCDCGTYDWYHLLQLIGGWESKEISYMSGEECRIITNEKNIGICCGEDYEIYCDHKIGLPKLPPNISPIPQDLNDLIAFKKGISIREAFDLNREELVGSWDELEQIGNTGRVYNTDQFPKHNSLFDARVIKAIYEKLS